MSKPILADQRQRERISAMAHVFRKTDRVLTGDAIDVVVDDSPASAPSWTDGRTITFNKAVIGSVTSIDDLIRLSGLNYHELAHCWYTPRSNSTIVKTITSEGLFDSFNVLEDQRIETFLTSKHPSTIPYLVSTFMRFCIQSENAWKTNYALVYGRKFIPADVRAEFKRRFIAQHLIPDIEAIIDEYRTLVYPKDADRGIELVRLFAQAMGSLPNIEDPHGHTNGNRPVNISQGRPATQKEQSDVADEIDDMDKELEDRDSNADAATKDSDDHDDADDHDGDGTGSDDDSDADDEGSGGGSDDSDDADSNGDSSGGSSSFDDDGGDTPFDSDDNSVSGGGRGASNNPNPQQSSDEDAIRKMFEAIAKQFESLPDVQEDISNKQRAIVNGDGDIDSSIDSRGGREFPVPVEDIAVARRFAATLDQLRSAADPGWVTRTSTGKVNMQRVINGADYDKVWDRWQEGNSDAADIECVITIDVSGSMMYCIDQAARAMWIIKRAMEIIDANVTVISFNHDTKMVYKKEQKVSKRAYRTMKADGSTMPREATTEAVRILEASRRHNKIFITITDGQWGGYYGCPTTSSTESMIEAMNGVGITTALAYIGYVGREGIDAHKCQVASQVNNPLELVDFAKNIVQQSMKKVK